MANLSRSQLTGLAQSVGFKGNDVNIAVAVALAESGGNPGATNMKGRDNSYGLWQINMKGSLGPDRRKKFGINNDTDLLRPAINAKAAKIVHGESGWGAWTTYTDGTYKEFLTKDPVLPTGPIVNTPGKVGTPEAVEADTTVSDGPLAGLNALGANLTKSVANFSGYFIAIAIGVLGVVILLRNSIPLPAAGKLVKKALK